jgi:anti-anti-sigma factor
MEHRESDLTFDIADNGGGGPTVTVRGELDISNVDRLEAAVAPVVAQRPQKLVVDVSGLTFADSSAIAAWVRWAAIVGEIEMRGASPLLREVITRMGLDRTLRLQT